MLRRVVRVGRLHAQEPVEGYDEEAASEHENEKEEQDDKNEVETEETRESWADWMVRATGVAEAVAHRAKVSDWVSQQRKRMHRNMRTGAYAVGDREQ